MTKDIFNEVEIVEMNDKSLDFSLYESLVQGEFLYLIRKERFEEYNKQFEELYYQTRDINAHISYDYYQSKVYDIMLENKGKKFKLKHEIGKHVSGLEENEYIIYKQIYGLRFEEEIDRISLEKFEIISYKKNKGEIDLHCNFLSHPALMPDEDSYFISVKISSKESSKASEIANEEFENFKCFFRVMLNSPLANLSFGFVPQGRKYNRTYCFGNGCVLESVKTENIKYNVKLDNEFFQKNMNRHYSKLLKILCKTNQNEIESRIIKSLRWLSDSLFEEELQMKFLKGMIAFEVLFTFSEKGYLVNPGIANQISETTAFVIGENSAERLEVEKGMKKLYGTRSSITHSGKNEIKDEEYQLLFKYACNALIFLTIEEKFKVDSVKEFYNVIKTMKYKVE